MDENDTTAAAPPQEEARTGEENAPVGPAPGSDAAVGPAGEGEGRVITISWPALLLPVVVLVAVGGGYLVGRQYSAGRSAAGPDGAARSGATATSNLRVHEMGALGSGVTSVEVHRSGEGGAPSITVIPPGGAGGGSAIEINPGSQASVVPADVVVPLPQSDHPLLGQPAPDFTMDDVVAGQPVTLGDLRGQPVLVNFWATWCVPCRVEMPWLQEVFAANEDDGFVVLAVDTSERVPAAMVPETVRRFADSMGLTFPVLAGENAFEVQTQWSVVGLPSSFLVDAEGVVVDVRTGGYPNKVTLVDHLSRTILPGVGG